MIEYKSNTILSTIKNNNQKVVLFGAGQIGEICLFAINQKGIKVDFFCDSSELKHGKKILGIKTISPEELEKFDKKTNIFISNNYVTVVNNLLKEKNFSNIYNCSEILDKADFKNSSLSLAPLKIERFVEFYKNMCLKDEYLVNGTLNLKSIDIQITERCSLKCKDCSNLMQYYKKPENAVLDVLFKAIERFMACVNNVYEFRIIGGDPFMNKDFHKVVNKLKDYEQVKKIAVYTNARIIPKGENLECLKNKKVILDISDYGLLDKSKKKVDEVIKVLKEHDILYTSQVFNAWSDCGRILPFQKRTEKELHRVFNNCCNSDILSLLHGKLYRCPFSANATNLKAIPHDATDIVNLIDETIPLDELKIKMKKLVYDKKSLTACNYCNGRDYTTPIIDAAIQTNKVLPY